MCVFGISSQLFSFLFLLNSFLIFKALKADPFIPTFHLGSLTRAGLAFSGSCGKTALQQQFSGGTFLCTKASNMTNVSATERREAYTKE